MPAPSVGPAEVARRLYGSTFGVPKLKITEAMTDWSELSVADQLYTIANLLYLNLQETARVGRRMGLLAARFEELLGDPEPPARSQGQPERELRGRPELRVAPPPAEVQLTEEGDAEDDDGADVDADEDDADDDTDELEA